MFNDVYYCLFVVGLCWVDVHLADQTFSVGQSSCAPGSDHRPPHSTRVTPNPGETDMAMVCHGPTFSK